ncbi:EPIDERMAL PATTERNING FACTOR-like protein 2 [Abeliophyllum distichum]|uniref:Epidermal patterning factor-like protein n=1 Tax=Abeliophyllum distichum TaxID=126358 RepID=A0ABD1SFM3_9LAMI
MGCNHRLHRFAISVLFLLISSSSQLRIFNGAEGRKLVQKVDTSKTVNGEKSILRGQIGSRPPRCERRCSSCAHCEAIQVPTNPQTRSGIKNSTTASTIAYARTDDNSNYKPMSWKCKCGSLIFNP